MANTLVSSTKALKITGTVTANNKNFSKTISGVSTMTANTAETTTKNIFKILDSGTAKTFSLVETDKYDIAG